jgi:hypothetical protein
VGDLSRSAIKALTQLARRVTTDASGAEGAGHTVRGGIADFAGWLGKRSDHVQQWRSRWFSLEGSTLSWSRNECGAPHGSLHLGGAAAWSDDFECGMPFSVLVSATAADRSNCCLYLAAAFHDEREAWLRALRLAIEGSAPVADIGPQPA